MEPHALFKGEFSWMERVAGAREGGSLSSSTLTVTVASAVSPLLSDTRMVRV